MLLSRGGHREDSDDGKVGNGCGKGNVSVRRVRPGKTDSFLYGRGGRAVPDGMPRRRCAVHVCRIGRDRPGCSGTADRCSDAGRTLREIPLRRSGVDGPVVQKFCPKGCHCGGIGRRHFRTRRLFSLRRQHLSD